MKRTGIEVKAYVERVSNGGDDSGEGGEGGGGSEQPGGGELEP